MKTAMVREERAEPPRGSVAVSDGESAGRLEGGASRATLEARKGMRRGAMHQYAGSTLLISAPLGLSAFPPFTP